MKTAWLVIVLVIIPANLALIESKREGNKDRQSSVRIIRSSDEDKVSIVNNKAKDNSDDDDDDDDDDDNTDNEQNQRGSGDASGDNDDDDDDEEGQDKAQKLVCKRRCAPPMTFDQCAHPRCSMKHNIVKELCYYLCKHQQVKCRETCEPE